MKSQYKRRQYPVIFRERQYRLLFHVLFYSVVLVAIFFFFLFVPDFYLMQDESASLEIRGYAADRVLNLHARLWPAILAVICLISLHSFRTFLFLIGPLKRLSWALDGLKLGDLTIKITLRRGDFLVEEGDQLNETVSTLSAGVQKAKSAVETARDALEDLSADIQSLPQEVCTRLAGNLQILQGSVEDTRQSLEFFRTDVSEAVCRDENGPAKTSP